MVARSMSAPRDSTLLETSAARLEVEVSIEASPEQTWGALVGATDAWWPRELRCVSSTSRMVLEPRAGGTLLEEDTDGGSLLWFQVIAVEPGRSLNLQGSLAPPYGGPADTFLLLRVEEHGAGSQVHLTYSLHGHLDPATLPGTRQDWMMLLEQGLKGYVEGAGRS